MGKYSNFGSGPDKFQNYGSGYPQPPMPQGTPLGIIPITFADFRGGFDARTLREGSPPNSTRNCLDFEISPDGRLRVMEGVSTVEGPLTHTPTKILGQVNLSGTTELVMFAPPFIGVKKSGATVWTDIGLSAKKLTRHTIFGDQLIFYGGSGTPFIRPAAGTAVAAAGIPKANAYGVFANRVYAAGLAIDGKYQPMGIGWSALSGDPTDFEGEGSNFELLIDEAVSGDEVLALRSLGLNLMAILCRHSIWIGRFQGIDERPADLQSREVGHGIYSAETARSTPLGVIYLARDGVRVFDSNSSRLLSERINSEILPLGNNPDSYRATYDPASSRYLLHTPDKTWIYYLSEDWWLPYSLVTLGGAFFATQVAAVKWSDLTGRTWEDLIGTSWQDLEGSETDPSVLYYIHNALLGKQDALSASVFGSSLSPTWEVPRGRGFLLHNLVETQGVALEYKGKALIDIWLPDHSGNMQLVQSKQLNQSGLSTKWCPCIHTGLTSGLLIKLRSFAGIEITQLQLACQAEAPTYQATIEDLSTDIPLSASFSLPKIGWAAAGVAQDQQITTPVFDSFSYMNLIAADGHSADEDSFNNPQNFGRIIGAPYNGYPDRVDIPDNNREGRHRAYCVLYRSQTGTSPIGRSFRFAALGSVNEIGMSFVLNLNNKTLNVPFLLARFHSSATQFPSFAGSDELNFEVMPDRTIRFARYDTSTATQVVRSILQLPVTGFIRLDIRFRADPANGYVKIVRVDTTPAVTLIDQGGLVTTRSGFTFNYPISYGGVSLATTEVANLTDGIMVHGIVYYNTSTLLPGQILGDIHCGTLQPASNGDTIQSTSAGGFFGSPTLPDRWKNLVYGSVEGFTECAVPHGDEGNSFVAFDGEGIMDLYHLDPPDAAATSIVAVIPNPFIGMTGSSGLKNKGRLVIKSGSTILEGPDLSYNWGGGGWQGAIPVVGGSYTALPKFVIVNDPATGLPFTPSGLANLQVGWKQITTQAGTGNRLTLLSVEYIYRT